MYASSPCWPGVLPFLLAPWAQAQGEIIIVDDVVDVVDFASPQTVAQLPGPDGRVTLREALIAANNTPGTQTIHFNVHVGRWPPLYDDHVLLYVDFDALLITDDSLTIDVSSLPAGVYVVRVTGETFAATRRATLLR